jgi:hypothetical protein
MKKVTPEFIREIFYSGQFGFKSDLEIPTKIAFLVNNNYLLFSKVIISTKERYLEICSNPAILKNRDEASGGSPEHVTLKVLAEEYIKNVYGVACKFEQGFAGFIPDVQSIDNHLICECGHTDNPEKLFTYFKHDAVRFVIQIPYPSDVDTEIYGYEFQASPNLIPFLECESKDASRAIKDILNRR